MVTLLIAAIAAFGLVVCFLAWAWLYTPKSENQRTLRAVPSQSTRRNRAWDAAVTRARNRRF